MFSTNIAIARLAHVLSRLELGNPDKKGFVLKSTGAEVGVFSAVTNNIEGLRDERQEWPPESFGPVPHQITLNGLHESIFQSTTDKGKGTEGKASFPANEEAFDDKSNTGRISQRHTDVHGQGRT